jgi:hypothetical protein
VRKPTYPDEEQDLAAYNGIVAAYAAAGKKQAGALLDLATILFRDLEEWVRSGRKTSAPTPRTLKNLADEVKGRDGDLVNEENLRRAFRRFRERLSHVNGADSHPYGVAVPEYRLRARFCGPAMEISARFPDSVWLDFEVLPDSPSKRAAVVPVASFVPPLPIGFCGRQQLLEPILKRALERKRSVVGFCGLPQVGKTAAATALAESYVTTMGGIAAFVDVRASRGGPLSDERVYRMLLAQLGVDELSETTDSLRPRVFGELHAQTGVVVFDDVGEGTFLRELAVPPGWLFIVTSRVANAIDGVRWFPVRGLDLADARSLLLTLSGRSAVEASREVKAPDVEYHWRERMEQDRSVWVEETTLDAFAALAYACDGLPGLIRQAAARLANESGLAVSEYVMRWTADAAWASSLLSFDVLAGFAAALDAVVADLGPTNAAIYRKLSLLTGPITEQAVEMIFQMGSADNLGPLAKRGLLVWQGDDKIYEFPALVHAHATAALRRNPEELARAKEQLTAFLTHNIQRLRDASMPQPERRDLIDWLRAYTGDVRYALRWTCDELRRTPDQRAIETFDVLSDAFAPSQVFPWTLIHPIEPFDREALVEIGLLYEGLNRFQSITAKSLYFRGVFSRNPDDFERAASLTNDPELKRACYEHRLMAVAATAPLRQVAELQLQSAEASETSDGTSLERWISAIRLYAALGDFRTVDRVVDRLRLQMKGRAPGRVRQEYSDISVILGAVAALRRRWKDVGKHAARAARLDRAGVATTLRALGAAGLGQRDEARRLLARVKYPERPSTPAPTLLVLTGAATHLLLGEGNRAFALLTRVVEAEVIPTDRRSVMEAFQAIALLLRANCQRMLGRVAEARIDGAKSLELLRGQQSRLWHAVAVLA